MYDNKKLHKLNKDEEIKYKKIVLLKIKKIYKRKCKI